MVRRILRQADPKPAGKSMILKYSEDSAGSIMTTEFVASRAHMSVAEAPSDPPARD